MRGSIIALICAMAGATFFSRVLPFVLPGLDELGPRARRVLSLVPAAALGSLILPGVFAAVPSSPGAGVLGVLAAVILVRIRGGLVIPVVLAVLVTWLALGFG
jgi:branched-subunit amino acid transport protein